MSLLNITELSHSFGDGFLFHDTELALNKGEHAGIVGPNGVGKSTLVKICTGQVIPDKGRVVWQPDTIVDYLDQNASIESGVTMSIFLKTAFADLYDTEDKMTECYQQAAAGDMKALQAAARYQEQLENNDFYEIDTKIDQVVTGLGLSSLGLDRLVTEMSGGQRAKVILAKLLLKEPDVMLLDEPTNFLDQEHIVWLAEYLDRLENAFMVVSHDYEFLGKIANRIFDIDNGKIKKYYGSYTEFLSKKEMLRESYIRLYTAQQREIKQTEEFIRKNIAGRKSKMARGRQKQLNRMERLDALALRETKPNFELAALPAVNTEYLKVSHLAVGYREPVLQDISFTVKGGQKVVITGFNGIGKSTLLRTLCGQIPALQGEYYFSEQVKCSYFEQELLWENQMITPLQIVSEAYPELTSREVRRCLARCGISNVHVMQPVGTLSGGEQAKVKMCLLIKEPCNFLIMDEPTNHLDYHAKESLQMALKQFTGTVLLVTHEEAFYKDWADQVIQIGNRFLPEQEAFKLEH